MFSQLSMQNIIFFVEVLILIITFDMFLLWLLRKKDIRKIVNASSASKNTRIIELVFRNVSSPLFVHIISPVSSDNTIVETNYSAIDFLGESVEGKSFDDFFALADESASVNDLISKVTIQEPIRVLVSLKRYPQLGLNFELSTQVIPTLGLAVTFVRDVTEEKDILNRLKESQFALTLAVETAGIAFFELDVKSKCFHCSKQWFIHNGLKYNPDGVFLDELLSHIKDGFETNYYEILDNVISGKQKEYSLEYQIKVDGKWVWRKVFARAKYRTRDGIATTIIGVSEDIDESKKINVELYKISRNFKILLENSPDLIYFKDRMHRFTWASKCIANYAGLGNVEKIIGKTDFDIHSPEIAEKFMINENKVLDKGETIANIEEAFFSSKGIPRWVLSTKIPIRNKENRIVGLIGLGKDITEYKNLSIELSNTQRLRSISRLAGGVAHDFNNALNGIMGFAYLLEGMLEKNTKEAQYVEHIIKSTEKCTELTRHLLAFARKGKYEVKKVDLHQIIQHSLSILQHSVSEDISIELNLAAKNHYIVADESQIENVVINITLNADKAMSGGGNLIIKTANNSYEANTNNQENAVKSMNNFICMSFIDNGIGIEKEVIGRVFEPFFSTKSFSDGPGLGLSAVYGIVENHNGFIDIESEVNVGTTVKVCLPVASEVHDN